MTISLLPSHITISALTDPLFERMQVSVSMARLDLIHDVVSGNKIFKLWYYLEKAKQAGNIKVVTYGGAWSNHLVATAFAAKHEGFQSKGIVRGEKQEPLSDTLKECIQYGMELEFISRSAYSSIHNKEGIDGGELHIPEGGFSETGAAGASLIGPLLPDADYYCVAVGSATTTAGLCKSLQQKNILCVPAIKNMTDLNERIGHLISSHNNNLVIDNRFHFGGFAKYDATLLDFMNNFYSKHKIKLDIVYTGKLMYTVYQKIAAGEFEQGSRICCLHTGGLQGNRGVDNGLAYL